MPFVVLLAITGVLLARTDTLKLDERYLTAEWLLDWYGISAAGDPISDRVRDGWVSWMGDTLYLDGKEIYQPIETFVGAVPVGPATVVASDRFLYLFSDTGELIEKVTPIGVDGAILSLAAGDNESVIVRSEGGLFASDLDMVAWRPVDGADLGAPRRGDPPAHIRTAILENYRGNGLPWERVMLDLHSGRLFGRYGPYLMDGAALLLLLLSATGIYNWVRRR